MSIAEIFTEKAVEEALSHLELKKNTCGPDGIYLSDLRNYWRINHEAVLEQLRQGRYMPGLVQQTEIISKTGKRRKISIFSSLDRLLLRCIARYLEDTLDQVFHANCFAFRSNLGISAAVSRMSDYIAQGFKWEVRVDIRDYFDSISLEKLKCILVEALPDKIILDLIFRFLHVRVIDGDSITPIKKGLLQGSPLSPLLANLYLTSLDEWIDEHAHAFCRYSDDIFVCFRERREAEAFYPILADRLRTVYFLDIRKEKSGVVDMGRQIFLGYSFHVSDDGETALAEKTRRDARSVYGDWFETHIRQSDKNYHLVNDGILSKKDYNILFENEDKKQYIPVETMGSLNIYSDVIFTSGFFRMAAQKNLYISIYNKHGELAGSFIPADTGYRSKTMLRQAEIYLDQKRRMQIAKSIEIGTMHNLRANLRYYAKVQKSPVLEEKVQLFNNLMNSMKNAQTIESLLLIEARARQVYFSAFNEILNNADFCFIRRTRRPPKDPINALISFGNTYLYHRVATEVNKTSLDLRIGFLHSTNKRSQSLNLDIAEIFKPLIVDRAIFTVINKRILNGKSHFRPTDEGGVYLNADGKKIFIQELDNKLYQRRANAEGTVNFDILIREEVQKILRFVNKGDRYKPYKYY